MNQHPLYIGIRCNQHPYPILFKKIPDTTATKETLISKGESLTKSVSETTYFGIFDDNSKPIMIELSIRLQTSISQTDISLQTR